MRALGRLVAYLGSLSTGKVALWCYLVWYLSTVAHHFDPSPGIWLNSIGISAFVGVALVLSVGGPAALATDRWQMVRLFLAPFCVSSFSSLIKDKGFILIVSPSISEVAISVALCACFVALVVLARRICRWAPGMGYSFRPAKDSDAVAVEACVHAAYRHYIERIGREPGPMLADYAEVIRQRQVTIAESGGKLAGVLVLDRTNEGFLLENVAVDPARKGKGLGRALLERAEYEARRAGFDSIYLYTHEKMTENRALYVKIGYVEYDRRTEAGLPRVFMRKPLP